MSSVSHADVIGIVLFLLLGAVSYYFYARMTQLERKVGLMENILFDLKITTEQTLTQMTDVDMMAPVSAQPRGRSSESDRFVPSFGSDDHEDQEGHEGENGDEEVLPVSQNSADTKELTIETPSSRVRGSGQQSVQVERESRSAVSVNYEAMTYKELQALAKQRGISGLRNVSKAQVIDALKARDGGSSSGKRSMEIPDIQTWMQDATPLDQRDDKIGGISGEESGAGTLLDEADAKELEVDASLVAETL